MKNKMRKMLAPEMTKSGGRTGCRGGREEDDEEEDDEDEDDEDDDER
jgi:hypothetical protein